MKQLSPCVLQLLSSSSRTCKIQLPNPCAETNEAPVPRDCAPQQEKAQQWEPWALQLESSPRSQQLEEVHAKQWRLSAAENKKQSYYLKNHKKSHTHVTDRIKQAPKVHHPLSQCLVVALSQGNLWVLSEVLFRIKKFCLTIIKWRMREFWNAKLIWFIVCVCVSCSVVSNSLRPQGL